MSSLPKRALLSDRLELVLCLRRHHSVWDQPQSRFAGAACLAREVCFPQDDQRRERCQKPLSADGDSTGLHHTRWITATTGYKEAAAAALTRCVKNFDSLPSLSMRNLIFAGRLLDSFLPL